MDKKQIFYIVLFVLGVALFIVLNLIQGAASDLKSFQDFYKVFSVGNVLKTVGFFIVGGIAFYLFSKNKK